MDDEVLAADAEPTAEGLAFKWLDVATLLQPVAAPDGYPNALSANMKTSRQCISRHLH